MNPKTCPNCDTPIPPHAPGGLCPACVLREADAASPSADDAPPPGEVAAAFPKLEILRLIGHGGMGFVYLARQPDLDRMVALKILSPALRRDPAFEERFAREARVLGKLKHPNIVTLYESGESGGYFYLMMEFVDGVNLRQAMSAGRFTPEQALAIVPAICDALQSAHGQGVWHRDIKPENILLDKDGGVKIADFGIARILGDPERNFTLTRTGGQLGSAAYMAPEQHEKPHSVDHRADIYSLGVVIYEMLTGELPLGRFPLPSQRAEVGKRIDEIVMRTLEKERELRQQSAGEVKTEVTRAAGTSSASAVTGSTDFNPMQPLLSGIGLVGSVAIFLHGLEVPFPSNVNYCLAGALCGLVAALKLTGLWPWGSPVFRKSNWPGRNLARSGRRESGPTGSTPPTDGLQTKRQTPAAGWGWLVGKFFGLTFTVPLAFQCANLSALGFLGFVGFTPGWERCFGFFGFFGLAGLAFLIEFLGRGSMPENSRPEPDLTETRTTQFRRPHIGLIAFSFAMMSGIIPTFFYWLKPWAAPRLSPGGQQFMLWLALACAIVAIASGLMARKNWFAVSAIIVGGINLVVRMLFFASAPMSTSQAPFASVQAGASLSFGPVVERVLPFNPKPGGSDKFYSQVSYIDFQTGSVICKQWKLEELAHVEKAWNTANGVDAIADEVMKREGGGHEVPGLDVWPRLVGSAGGSVFISAKRDETFDSLRAADVDANLQRMREPNPSHHLTTNADPYWFQTGDGAKGVVQILGRTEDGSGMRIRYKLVQGAPVSGEETKPNDLKPISAEAVAAYRELQEILHSKQPREFADPDVAKEFGELLKTFGESLKGTRAEPLWSKAQQVTMDSRRAFARGDDAEHQRLDREEKQLEQELETLMQQAGAPIFPGEEAAGPSKPQASKAVAAPVAIFGRQSERVLKSNMANRDGVVGYRFKDNDEVAVPDSLTGHFKDGKGSRFTPELKQWMRDNHADVLVCFSGETYDVLTMDMRDRFVAEALEWSDVPPEKAARVLAPLEKTNAEPGFGMTIGRSLKSGASDVNVVRTRDGFTGYWQIRPIPDEQGRGLMIHTKQILTQQPAAGEKAASLLPGSEFTRTVGDSGESNSHCILSLDTGEVSALPEELKTKLEVQNTAETDVAFIAWMKEHKADAVGRVVVTHGKVVKFGLRIFNAIPIPVDDATASTITPADVTKRFQEYLTQWGFIAEVNDLMIDPGKPAAFLIQTRSGRQGILRITGFEDSPRGVNIHFHLTHIGREDQAKGTITGPAFGPVRELVVNDSMAKEGNNALDLDSGKLLTLPTPTAKADFDWMLTNGIDAIANMDDSATQGLVGAGGMVAKQIGNDQWETIKPDELIAITMPLKPDFRGVIGLVDAAAVVGKPSLPVTFAFRTRDGGMGVLQALGHIQNPSGVKIRYKLAQKLPATD